MRLPTFILALTVSAVAALPALAQTYKTPKALLKALYSYDTDNSDAEAPSPYSTFFSDHLNKLLQTDLDNTPEGNVGAIDFDPVIAGQDGAASDVRIGQPILLDDKAEVEVEFENGEEVTLFYTLVREHGGWKVDDIANQKGDNPWSLGALLGDAQ
ncbi:DUF3828 domain-containing protein [Rhizobium leguminosarum]|uniref:DUF3828 domain-containing protein n=1 Tax=Rhizobium leguminosarum TaxID=384 RepID=UPI001C94AC4B|nr:DUF3828 domain-containing protein [Rhizobium leguminosarum]MBY5333178.1 DUF3828 domain-containing protein [Rhizobium leguminosarum]MBY5346701.1 DUF3828 domain-containing protein [Rhizobium leguminosarum]